MRAKKLSSIVKETSTSLTAYLTDIQSDDASVTLVYLKGRHILTSRTARCTLTLPQRRMYEHRRTNNS